MTLSQEMARFKAQYAAAEWQRLMSWVPFALAWDAKDIVRAGEEANKVLMGNFSSAQLARILREIEF